jgi:hypothetical protein
MNMKKSMTNTREDYFKFLEEEEKNDGTNSPQSNGSNFLKINGFKII